MASITVRNIPDKTKEILRVQAAQCGISLEAYVRRILEETSVEKERDNGSLLELANEFFGPKNGVDLNLPARGTKRPAVRFD